MDEVGTSPSFTDVVEAVGKSFCVDVVESLCVDEVGIFCTDVVEAVGKSFCVDVVESL